MLGSASMVPKSQIAHLVAKRFVVVVPEYRLCPQVSLYDGPIQDAKDVLKWAQEELPALLREARNIEADAARVVAMGHSAGGLLALTTVCNGPAMVSEGNADSHRACARTHHARLSTFTEPSTWPTRGIRRN